MKRWSQSIFAVSEYDFLARKIRTQDFQSTWLKANHQPLEPQPLEPSWRRRQTHFSFTIHPMPNTVKKRGSFKNGTFFASMTVLKESTFKFIWTNRDWWNRIKVGNPCFSKIFANWSCLVKLFLTRKIPGFTSDDLTIIGLLIQLLKGTAAPGLKIDIPELFWLGFSNTTLQGMVSLKR